MSGLHFDSISDMPEGMRKLVQKQMEKTSASGREIQAVPQKETKRKYHNLPTERILPNGECIRFGSKKEAGYYDKLLAMQKAGVVKNIKLQYQYLIKPAYTDGETGERFRAVSYLADFVFDRLVDGKWREIVVDTKGGGRKGTKTKEYIIKRKLLAERGIIIEEA